MEKGSGVQLMVNRKLQAAYRMLALTNQTVKKRLAYPSRAIGIIDAAPSSLTTAFRWDKQLFSCTIVRSSKLGQVRVEAVALGDHGLARLSKVLHVMYMLLHSIGN